MKTRCLVIFILLFTCVLFGGCGEALNIGMQAAQVGMFAAGGAKMVSDIDKASQAKAEKFFSQAQQYQKSGQFAMAEESIKTAIEIWPAHNQYRSFLGSLYYQMAMQRDGDVEYLKKSREAFLACVEGNEKNSKLLNEIAWCFFLVGDNPDEGLKYVNQAIDVDGRNPAYVGTRGCLKLQKAEYSQAISELEEASNANRSSNPQNAGVDLYFLALAYAKSGDSVKSQIAFSEAIKLQPTSYHRKVVEPQLQVVKQ